MYIYTGQFPRNGLTWGSVHNSGVTLLHYHKNILFFSATVGRNVHDSRGEMSATVGGMSSTMAKLNML